MLSHCANSQCSKPFLRLREAKLFLVETPGMEKQEGHQPNSSHAEEASAAGGAFLAL
jgi:hypothetical protein